MSADGPGSEFLQKSSKQLKVERLKLRTANKADEQNVTYSIDQEDHTLANAVRHLVAKNPEVEFCGYSIPHPSEERVLFRIQTTPKTTAKEAFSKALSDLIKMCDVTEEKFKESLRAITNEGQ